MPNTFWWLLNFERYVHVFVSFRCIFLICSCHLSNHPSICELFYIQVLMMVNETETLTSTLHHDIFTYLDYIFSCYLHIYIYIYIYIYMIIESLRRSSSLMHVSFKMTYQKYFAISFHLFSFSFLRTSENFLCGGNVENIVRSNLFQLFC